LQTSYRGDVAVKDLLHHVGKTVRILGDFVTYKPVMTIKGGYMSFGTFLDVNGEFFDTTHFPPSLKQYLQTGGGWYLIQGKVVEEFGFPSIEVDKCAKLPIVADTRA